MSVYVAINVLRCDRATAADGKVGRVHGVLDPSPVAGRAQVALGRRPELTGFPARRVQPAAVGRSDGRVNGSPGRWRWRRGRRGRSCAAGATALPRRHASGRASVRFTSPATGNSRDSTQSQSTKPVSTDEASLTGVCRSGGSSPLLRRFDCGVGAATAESAPRHPPDPGARPWHNGVKVPLGGMGTPTHGSRPACPGRSFEGQADPKTAPGDPGTPAGFGSANLTRAGPAEMVGTFFLIYTGTATAVAATLGKKTGGSPPDSWRSRSRSGSCSPRWWARSATSPVHTSTPR